MSDDSRKVATHRLVEMKQRGGKISMLTVCDYTMMRIVGGVGMDVILVGNSASNTIADSVTIPPIILDQVIYHAKSVVCGAKRAMAAIDVPFGSYQSNETEGLASVTCIMKESHADTLKFRGGEEIVDTIRCIVCTGIPVVGRLGLISWFISKYGTYIVRTKDDAETERLVHDAHLLKEAGYFTIVLEKISTTLAECMAPELTVSIISIGVGGHMDGQILAIQDMFGMNNEFRPHLLHRYADLYTVITDTTNHYVSDMENCYFPSERRQY